MNAVIECSERVNEAVSKCSVTVRSVCVRSD